MLNQDKNMETVVNLAKNRGFVYAGSEIYGGLSNSWDYGPLGVELKNNVKRAWWKKFIQENPYNVGVDCAILMNTQTWVASGHIGSFSGQYIYMDMVIADVSPDGKLEALGSKVAAVHCENIAKVLVGDGHIGANLGNGFV